MPTLTDSRDVRVAIGPPNGAPPSIDIVRAAPLTHEGCTDAVLRLLDYRPPTQGEPVPFAWLAYDAHGGESPLMTGWIRDASPPPCHHCWTADWTNIDAAE